MTDNRRLEELTWDELQQAVEKFIAADVPNTKIHPYFIKRLASFGLEQRAMIHSS